MTDDIKGLYVLIKPKGRPAYWDLRTQARGGKHLGHLYRMWSLLSERYGDSRVRVIEDTRGHIPVGEVSHA